MELQQALDRFKADLEAYIQAEVARQMAAQMRSISPGVSRVVQSSTDVASAQPSQESIQASLDELAALIQSGSREVTTDAVDELVSAYGSDNQFQSAAPSPVASTDYMTELQQLRQMQNSSVDMSGYDKLVSMNGEPSDAIVPQPPQPSPSAVTVTSNVAATGQLSGIQSFLQKIRQRKNLSSN